MFKLEQRRNRGVTMVNSTGTYDPQSFLKGFASTDRSTKLFRKTESMKKRKQPDKRLTWRMDPEESRSDWTIEVAVPTSKDSYSKVYHVHQCILGVGPKKGNFFVKLFRSPFSESEMKSSRMEFVKEVADAFPIMLDFMYSHDDLLDVTVANIPHLMTLADYLDIIEAREKIAAYCLTNSGIQTCAIFYGYGKDYKFLELQKESIKICHNHLLEICPDSSSMAKESRLKFWLDVQKNIKDKDADYLLHYSRHIAAFCFSHKQQLNVDNFEKLTSPDNLPHIHFNAAMQLLQVELELKEQDAMELSDLQARCVDALASSRKTHTVCTDHLVCLHPLVLTTLLKKILENADKESSRLSKTNQVTVRYSDSYESYPEVAGVYSLDPKCSYGHHCFFRKGHWKNKQSTFFSLLCGKILASCSSCS